MLIGFNHLITMTSDSYHSFDYLMCRRLFDLGSAGAVGLGRC